MKILLVNDYATPVGGVEILILMLRDRLRERGHEVRVFASSARPEEGELCRLRVFWYDLALSHAAADGESLGVLAVTACAGFVST